MMARSNLQRLIRNRKGLVISEATHRVSDLLEAAYAVIKRFELQPDFKSDLFVLACKGEDELNHGDSREKASDMWNQEIVDYFNMIAPRGYYFGTHEGDGACFGWFKVTKEMAVM